MSWLMRVMVVVPLLAVAGFCGFGFLATFEPLDPVAQVTWRVIYGLVGLSSLASIIWLVLPHDQDSSGNNSRN